MGFRVEVGSKRAESSASMSSRGTGHLFLRMPYPRWQGFHRGLLPRLRSPFAFFCSGLVAVGVREVDKYFLSLMAAHHHRDGQVHVSVKEGKLARCWCFEKYFSAIFLPYIDADEKYSRIDLCQTGQKLPLSASQIHHISPRPYASYAATSLRG